MKILIIKIIRDESFKLWDIYVNGIWDCPAQNTLKKARRRVQQLVREFKERNR